MVCIYHELSRFSFKGYQRKTGIACGGVLGLHYATCVQIPIKVNSHCEYQLLVITVTQNENKPHYEVWGGALTHLWCSVLTEQADPA